MHKPLESTQLTLNSANFKLLLISADHLQSLAAQILTIYGQNLKLIFPQCQFSLSILGDLVFKCSKLRLYEQVVQAW